MLALMAYICLSFIAAAVIIKLLWPVAFRLSLVDKPNERKLHAKETPLIGGVGIFIAYFFMVLLLPHSLSEYRALFLGSAILVILGMLDDFYDISPKLRLLIQLICALLVLFPGGLFINNLGAIWSLHSQVHLPMILAALLTIIFVMGLINAMNMLDGQDGLLGGVTVVQIGWMSYIAYQCQLVHDSNLLVIMIGCVLGFLAYNYRGFWRKQASVFLGDSGSTFLGFFCAFFAVSLSQNQVVYVHHFAPVCFLWVLAVPIFDLIGAIIRRLATGNSPILPDRGHLHHILGHAGLRVELSTPILCLFSFLMGLFGVLSLYFGMSQRLSLIIFFICLFVYSISITISYKSQHVVR